MAKPVRMHVARTPSKYVDKAGNVHRYESILVRRTFRDGAKVRHETLANLSKLPAEVVTAIESTLKGQSLVPAEAVCTIGRSLPHGHVAAVPGAGSGAGVDHLAGDPTEVQAVHAGVVARHHVGGRPRCGRGIHRRDLRCDGLAGGPPRRDRKEAGRQTPRARGKSGPDGVVRPVQLMGDRAVLRAGRARLFPRRQERLRADRVRHPHRRRGPPGGGAGGSRQHRRPDRVRPDRDRDERQLHPRQPGAGRRPWDDHHRPHHRAARTQRKRNRFRVDHRAACPAGRQTRRRRRAAADEPVRRPRPGRDRPPRLPGERLIACRNPLLAVERARKRDELLTATEKLLDPIIARVAAGRLSGADEIGVAVGKVIDKYKVGKHFHRTITDTALAIARKHHQIAAEVALDGIYVLRTSVPTSDLTAAGVVESYKNLANVERDFRIIKVDDLDLRPIHHRLEDRVKAHVLICMLACYLVWHLRKAWAPMTFTDQHPPTRDNPVAPAHRSADAQAKASTRHDPDGNPLRSFRSLLDHLATLTRNQIRYHGTNTEVPTLAEPTPDQRRAFELIGTPIPLTAA